MDDGDDRASGNFDDLFDDLDRFFQPSDDAYSHPERRDVATRDLEERAEADLTGDEPTISVSGTEPVIHPSGAANAPVPVPATAADAQEDEWARLHDVLREPEGTGDPSAGSIGGGDDPAPGDALFDFLAAESEHGGGGDGYGTEWSVPERGEDEPPELTLEDLKKAPPQYRDLPVGDPGPRERRGRGGPMSRRCSTSCSARSRTSPTSNWPPTSWLGVRPRFRATSRRSSARSSTMRHRRRPAQGRRFEERGSCARRWSAAPVCSTATSGHSAICASRRTSIRWPYRSSAPSRA